MKPPGGSLKRVPFPVPLDAEGRPRWSTLSPGGPLASRSGLARTGIRSASLPVVTPDGAAVLAPAQWQRRRRPETGFPRAVKLAVRKRAGDGVIEDAACEACGRWLGRDGGEVQHRASRGAGGCKDEVINGPANAVLLCGHGAAHIRSGCHGACEDREPHMAMDAGGFWIEHGTTLEYDPRHVSILLHSVGGSGIQVWLAMDGTYAYGPPDRGVSS